MKKTEIGLIPVSIGLFSMMMLLVIPGSTALGNDTFVAYGVATITQFDTDKNPISTQSVHNQLFDAGENFMLAQTFTGLGGAPTADNVQIGAICLNAVAASSLETLTASDFNTANELAQTTATSQNCITGGAVTAENQIATIGPIEFTAGTHALSQWSAGENDILSVGICSADVGGDGTSVTGCAGTLFAVASVNPTGLDDTETVTVTYTFNLDSDGT